MSEQTILWELVDGVARLTINRPERRNAIDAASREVLLERLAEARSNPAVRALLLTGTGGSFCTGADLSAGPAPAAPAPAPATPDSSPDGPPRIDIRAAGEALRGGAQRLVRTLWELDKPTVAAVDGPAAGLGAHLALACDLVIMAEGARLIEVFARRGLVVDAMGAYLLPRLVGLGRAKQIVFFADDIHAEQALSWGLAQHVVAADQLADESMAWAARLAKGPTRALGMSKQLLNRSLESSLDQSLHDEAMAVAANTQYADMKEGMISFLQRRPPEFAGR
jgi:2-(1,2-epoxy-1,2-dihydrophenyl)acetyl-CoA isomerase